MKPTTSLLAVSLLLFQLAVTTAGDTKGQDESLIKCDSQDDCWGKNAHCDSGFCSCSIGFTMRSGDCFLEEDYDYIDKFNKKTTENENKRSDSINKQNEPA